MHLEFFDWHSGHHQQCPQPIPDIQSPEQALLILQAISAAITQPGCARARLVHDTEPVYRDYYLADDHAVQNPEFDGLWSDLPVVLIGPHLVGDGRAAEAVIWHLDLVYTGPVDAWDGSTPLDGDTVACTALTAQAVQALPRDPRYPPLRIVEVTPELLDAALEDALDNGIIEAETV